VSDASIGQIVARVWEETMDKFRALEGRDVFDWPMRRKAGIRRGTWRGAAYVHMWDFRTGEAGWRKL
jgi:hypothetical protein